MRDNIKSITYFDEYIEQQETRLKKFQAKLVNNEVREDRIIPVKEKIYSISYSLFKAYYSFGEDLQINKERFEKLIPEFACFWTPQSGYVEILHMISIALMYQVNKEEWSTLYNLVNDNSYDDWLIYFLFSYRDGNKKYEQMNFRMNNPYGTLKDIAQCNSRDDRVNKLNKYLKKEWYQSHKEMAWYDIHKHSEKLYSGYWSYEAGAVAKILGIDDTKLRDVQYYPYDMVHYQSQ